MVLPIKHKPNLRRTILLRHFAVGVDLKNGWDAVQCIKVQNQMDHVDEWLHMCYHFCQRSSKRGLQGFCMRSFNFAEQSLT